MIPFRLLRGFLTVGVWTLASRLLGFIRDILIAAFLGSGPVAEAFLIAFALPNMFRRFFAEGAFNMAFVPMFSKKVETGNGAETFARDAFSGLATVLILFTLAAQVFMPWLVLAMASGFAGDERFALAVGYGRVAFVYILFISLAALLSGVLNALGQFAAAAAAPVLLNVILISALLLADSGLVAGLVSVPDTENPVANAHLGSVLVWAVVLAGIAQMALVWVAASRAGFRLRPVRPRLTPELRRLVVIAVPAALAGGVMQVNLLVGRQVASFFDGAIAWLNYADRLYQLPLGVVGIAIGVVLLPELSRRLGAGDAAAGRHSFNRAAEFALLMTLPAAVALMVIAEPLVSVLFQRGRFTAEDTQATALALAIYGLGLPAFVMQKVLQPLYFAREDTRTPFRFAVYSMFINAGLAIGLAPVIGFLAAAIGTTAAGWAMVVLLYRGRGGMGHAAEFDSAFAIRARRILIASLAMGVFLLALEWLLQDALHMARWRYLALAGLVVGGAASYFGIGQAIGAVSLREIRGLLRR